MEVVDTETAKEFMQETLTKVDAAELDAICTAVEAKSAWFRKTLSRRALPDLSAADYAAVLPQVFGTRGKPRRVLGAADLPAMRGILSELLDGDDDPGARLQAFVDRLGPDVSGASVLGTEDKVPLNVRVDFGTELLHFARPDKHWLWTRWMWDPKNRTGALPLVTTAAYDLSGKSSGAIYMKVGNAVAFVHEVGEAAGFQRIRRNVFGTDVYLCCVYVVYAYTVLRMRMTQEFNKVMPGLPEFCRRLLGVHVKKQKQP